MKFMERPVVGLAAWVEEQLSQGIALVGDPGRHYTVTAEITAISLTSVTLDLDLDPETTYADHRRFRVTIEEIN